MVGRNLEFWMQQDLVKRDGRLRFNQAGQIRAELERSE
jgi:hypothetical protein